MRRPFLKYTASMALACAAAATPLFAQVNTGVGADPTTHIDANWVVGANNLESNVYTQHNAVVVQSPPSAWANTSPNSFWIGSTTSGSLPGGIGDGAQRFSYGYQTFFTSSTDPIRMTVWTDNVFNWFSLDGTAFSAIQTGEPSTAFGPQVFTLNPTTSGQHTLLLQTVGDGQTDGINVQFSSVPEPSSMALLGTGLVGLIPMIRRRRKS
jgi:hypothetical protein